MTQYHQLRLKYYGPYVLLSHLPPVCQCPLTVLLYIAELTIHSQVTQHAFWLLLFE